MIPTLTGTVFFLLIPVHLKRSMFGWYDNDPHNVLFPLAVIACLIWGFDKIADRKKRTIAALFCAALLMLYACFWQGWVYLFSIIIFAGALIFLYCRFVVNDRPTAKNTAQYFGILAAGTLIALGLFFGPREFFVLFQEGTKAIGEFLSPQLSLWPNMYISVGELRSASVADILELSGGLFVFVVALMGLGYSCRRAIAHRNTAREPWLVILLGVFFVISFMITLGAQRFAILFLTPLCLCFLLGLQEIFTFVKQKTDKTFVSRKFYIKTVYVALSILMLGITLVPIGSAREKTRSLLDPIFNPVWENVLEKIRTQTPPESIINTWWPPGHFISAIAERRVTFDGATINVPQAYWMAKVFLSNSEEQAMGILRMLNNSGNTAALYLQSLGIDLSVGVERILQVLPMSRPDAATALADILTLEQTGHLLALTHPKETTPSYLLIYRELMDKNLELGFVGRWNFTKMEYLRANPESALDIPKRKSKEYVNFLWDTIGGPLRYSEILTQLGVDENKILLEENLTVDLTTMSARINSSTYGKGTPQSIFYSNGESVIEHPLAGANLNFSLVLIRQKNAYIGILMDKALARSLLVRLFWFEGKGLKYFKPFCKDTDLTQRTQIYVYEEDWNKFLSDSSP